MKTFDYIAAWEQVAKPAFEALPEDVKKLYRELPELRQGPTLAVECPLNLLPAFGAIGTRQLAIAAIVCNNYGHWWPGGRDPHAGNGWRFANIADQLLAKRLGYRSRFEREGNGISRRIIEGVIRVCGATNDSWQWVEVGLADEQTAAEANGFSCTLERRHPKYDPGDFDEKAHAMRAAIFARDPEAKLLIDHEPFMVEEEQTTWKVRARAAARAKINNDHEQDGS